MLATLLWILPFSIFGFSLAWDYSQAIAVTREATLTAEAMANAGATAFTAAPSGEGAVLDPFQARARASETYQRALSSGMLRRSSAVAGVVVTPTPTYVTVSVPVSTRMTMASLLISILTPGAAPITVDTVGRARTDVCVPGTSGPSGAANCVYPTDDF